MKAYQKNTILDARAISTLHVAIVYRKAKTMNEELQDYARKRLKEDLPQLTDMNRLLFKRMYSPKNVGLPINDIINAMSDDCLDRAMRQVKNTFIKLIVRTNP